MQLGFTHFGFTPFTGVGRGELRWRSGSLSSPWRGAVRCLVRVKRVGFVMSAVCPSTPNSRHLRTRSALRICANKRHHGSQNWNTLSQSALRISLAHGDRIADFEEHQVRAETVLAPNSRLGLPWDGALVVYDPLIDDDRRQAHGLLSSLNMLIETASGSEYTVSDCKSWMSQTGFRDIQALRLDGLHTAVFGFKKKGSPAS
jgi:hypothetical protein